jgi:spermidine synthase
MLGHMPALLHPRPQSVLIVGFGAGVTAGTFVPHPTIGKIVICEMEPIIPPIATRFFARENYNVMNDPRTRIYYDDARHFALTTRDRFDIVTSDPIHPWVKGSATLYSREYFELVRERLNPGGLVTQWVPLYESSAEVVKSEIATFFEVFPGGSVWANDIDGGGYDLFLLGRKEPGRIDVDALEARLEEPGYARVAESLRAVGLGTAGELLSTYAGQDRDLKPWLEGAQINRDGNLRLQYMAGLAVNANAEQAIYNEMLKYRQYPSNLFAGSGGAVQTLKSMLNGR